MLHAQTETKLMFGDAYMRFYFQEALFIQGCVVRRRCLWKQAVFEYFQGGDCLCSGNLLIDES